MTWYTVSSEVAGAGSPTSGNRAVGLSSLLSTLEKTVARSLKQGSASLAFHKWHPYDGDLSSISQGLERKESRVGFLRDVAKAVSRIVVGEDSSSYQAWFERYRNALEAVGVVWEKSTVATTQWRLVPGMATNPALMTGLSLHSALSFPFIPGSSVRGLVKARAELSLLESDEGRGWVEAFLQAEENQEEQVLPEDWRSLLESAEALKEVFGSLTLERGVDPDRDPMGWVTPRTLLSTWAKSPSEDQDRIRILLSEHTSGVVAFYDAVPLPQSEQKAEEILLEDCMTPHYPEFFDDPEHAYPPSDDQDPRPISFLTVGPGVLFAFPFRLKKGAEGSRERVQGWLKSALEEDGLGAKTAAGYGYLGKVAEVGKGK